MEAIYHRTQTNSADSWDPVWLVRLPSKLPAAPGGDRGGMWSYEDQHGGGLPRGGNQILSRAQTVEKQLLHSLEPLAICIKEEFSLPITARVHFAYSILAFPPLGIHSSLALWKHSKEKEMFSLHQDEESTEASSIPVSPGQEASSMVQFL